MNVRLRESKKFEERQRESAWGLRHRCECSVVDTILTDVDFVGSLREEKQRGQREVSNIDIAARSRTGSRYGGEGERTPRKSC